MTTADTSKDLALPKGSLILVTGATGHIASHVINEALALGYRVRGTARSQAKADETKKLFTSPDYETAVVAHMAEDGAFDNAVKGVDAIIHLASVVSFSPNPHEVIPDVIAGATGILTSATKEPSMKRFVYTSSSTAASEPKMNVKFPMDKTVWNSESLQVAWAPPPYKPESAFAVYAASKTEAEQAVWKFVKEHRPHFVVNAVLPNANFGRVLASPGNTGACVIDIYNGKFPSFPPQWMIDVQDDARIHLAAIMDSTLANERIFAFDSPFNWNSVIDSVRKARPNAKTLPEYIKDEPHDLSEVDNQLGAELLRKWFGTSGYKGLDQSVVENLEGIT